MLLCWLWVAVPAGVVWKLHPPGPCWLLALRLGECPVTRGDGRQYRVPRWRAVGGRYLFGGGNQIVALVPLCVGYRVEKQQQVGDVLLVAG